MPLPSPLPRRCIHRRHITVEGFLRDDGLLELDACLRDTKTVDYPLASGLRPAGEPIHELHVRVAVDEAFTIVEADACLDRVPYPGGCDSIAPAYQQLRGLNLIRGFRQAVRERFGEVEGCSHVSELLLSLPTAAIQTRATFIKETDGSGGKPFQLDQCHALDTRGETVREFYPAWYRGPA